MNWLARQLFGSHVADHLRDKVEAAVATYLLAQPDAAIAQVKAQIVGRADSLIASVLVFVPAWARPLLVPVLYGAIAKLVDDAFSALVASARKIATAVLLGTNSPTTGQA